MAGHSLFIILGKVVYVGQRHCFIDGDIIFSRQCCINSYIPCKGDTVTGKMVECDQGQQWRFRALTVESYVKESPAQQYNKAAGDGQRGRCVLSIFTNFYLVNKIVVILGLADF